MIRIRDKLIRERPDCLTANGKVLPILSLKNFKMLCGTHYFVIVQIVSPLVDLANDDNLFGLATRIVASESSVYLALQLDTLKAFIEQHIPATHWESIAQLIDQVCFE